MKASMDTKTFEKLNLLISQGMTLKGYRDGDYGPDREVITTVEGLQKFAEKVKPESRLDLDLRSFTTPLICVDIDNVEVWQAIRKMAEEEVFGECLINPSPSHISS